MAVTSANYLTVQTALRRCLANGGHLTGEEKRLALDVLQHSANVLDGVTLVADVNTKADALEALLVTHLAIVDAVGAGDASVEVDAMIAALATPRSDLVAAVTAAVAAGGDVTDLVVSDELDGRAT